MKLVSTLVASLLIASSLLASADAADHADRKVVIHVDENDPARMNLALNNVANLKNITIQKSSRSKFSLMTISMALNDSILMHNTPIAGSIVAKPSA